MALLRKVSSWLLNWDGTETGPSCNCSILNATLPLFTLARATIWASRGVLGSSATLPVMDMVPFWLKQTIGFSKGIVPDGLCFLASSRNETMSELTSSLVAVIITVLPLLALCWRMRWIKRSAACWDVATEHEASGALPGKVKLHESRARLRAIKSVINDRCTSIRSPL